MDKVKVFEANTLWWLQQLFTIIGPIVTKLGKVIHRVTQTLMTYKDAEYITGSIIIKLGVILYLCAKIISYIVYFCLVAQRRNINWV